MRLVHAGNDTGRGGPVAAHSSPQRGRDRGRHERPYLPVRHVSAGGCRDSLGGSERRPGMISRRDFFTALGGGLVVVLIVDDSDAQEAGGGARRGTREPLPQQVSAWLHIGEDGNITCYTGKVEVGQNSRTSLTQAVAEELHAPVASIAVGHPCPMARFRHSSPPECRKSATPCEIEVIENRKFGLRRPRCTNIVHNAGATPCDLKPRCTARWKSRVWDCTTEFRSNSGSSPLRSPRESSSCAAISKTFRSPPVGATWRASVTRPASCGRAS
ncbi:hypothetical protein SBA4_2060007 [Candidatus Sulfopaludibacter sp. SbA4]|nr:hypothetical protein SBA4_2060007 [Candidatus Sulfopaludibacter sp. SbA4]